MHAVFKKTITTCVAGGGGGRTCAQSSRKAFTRAAVGGGGGTRAQSSSKTVACTAAKEAQHAHSLRQNIRTCGGGWWRQNMCVVLRKYWHVQRRAAEADHARSLQEKHYVARE